MTNLRIVNLTKNFGELFSLRIESLTLEGGEVVALVGPNGAGKSTLVKILAGTLKPDSGFVKVNNDPLVLGQPLRAKQAGITLLAQTDDLFEHLSVSENVTVGRERAWGWGPFRFSTAWSRDKLANRYLREVGRADLNTTSRVHVLSGGQRKSVILARALLSQPKVIIFDESINSLGVKEQAWLRSMYRRFADEGRVVIVISHSFAEIRAAANRIVAIQDGVIKFDVVANQLDDSKLIDAMSGTRS